MNDQSQADTSCRPEAIYNVMTAPAAETHRSAGPAAWGLPGTTMNKLLCCALVVSPWPRGRGATRATGRPRPRTFPRIDGDKAQMARSLSQERFGVKLETSFKLTVFLQVCQLEAPAGYYAEERGTLDL